MAVVMALWAGVLVSSVAFELTTLPMLASTMMPEAYEEGGPVVGAVTTIGFLSAFVLSRVT